MYPSLGNICRFAQLLSFTVFEKYPKVATFRKMLFFSNSQSLVHSFSCYGSAIEKSFA